ncbi:HlyU family transcriptional regulator [Rhizobium oryzicola]|uniref:HlyU family transcriptional regulator n=1 Tax=Rhizobium oryzicola TaxID=1232668 RepID=A0ABT8T2S3_9HYPH|nr:HlyU family transcriptional regulator [Rhizobium oryzicola]MDO1585054.1 HlyU family transcriptional regulator [Rhizobium oryzicola]
MASIFSNLFSLFSGGPGGKAEGKATPASEPQIHEGCRIFAEPMKEGGQYRLAGRIEKEVEGQILVRTFVRADVFTSLDDALECTFRKARQIIDQNGPSLFADGAASRTT